MNKQEFLKELQGRIRILAEAEQQDILAEYAQHIDLRTASGLTEEEAIRDFGDPGQLAAEILEAYRVDPAQLGGAPERRPPLGALPQSLRRAGAAAGGFFHRLGGFCRRLGGGMAAFFRRAGRRAAAGLETCGQALLFRRRPKPDTPVSEPMKEESPVNPNPPSPSAPSAPSAPSRAGRTARRAARALGRVLRAAARLVWNLALLLLAAPFGLAAMAALLCIGLLAVLLVQGYPLAGMLLVCLGGGLCCAAVLGLLATLIWRGPRPAPAAEAAGEAPVPPPPCAPPMPRIEAAAPETSPRQAEEGEDDHA